MQGEIAGDSEIGPRAVLSIIIPKVPYLFLLKYKTFGNTKVFHLFKNLTL